MRRLIVGGLLALALLFNTTSPADALDGIAAIDHASASAPAPVIASALPTDHATSPADALDGIAAIDHASALLSLHVDSTTHADTPQEHVLGVSWPATTSGRRPSLSQRHPNSVLPEHLRWAGRGGASDRKAPSSQRRI